MSTHTVQLDHQNNPVHFAAWRDTAARAVLAFAVLTWFASVIAIWSYGFLVAAASMPLFILGVALWPSRAHLIIAALGLAWAFMWIAFVLHDFHGIQFGDPARILASIC